MRLEAAKGAKDSANGPAYDYVPAYDGLAFVTAPEGECFKGVYCETDADGIRLTLLDGTARTLNVKAGGHIFLFFTAFEDVPGGSVYGLL